MIYFLRHGETPANAAGRFSGLPEDDSLTPQGEQQVERTGQEILSKGTAIRRIVRSNTNRTRQTAEIVATILGHDLPSILIDERLAEYDMGELIGRPSRNVTAKQRVSAPGAEDPQALQDRIAACIQDYKQLPGNTLFVTHDGVVRIVEVMAAGMDPERMYELKAVPNARFIELD